MKYAAFNINFDSLGEAYGFPPGYRDKSILDVSKRFLALADRYGFRYSIYVIGKDLEKPENQEMVKDWASQGHEIGNHSWSHPVNLGTMSTSEIRREVEMAHDIITETTGREPEGFIAPGWSTSSELLQVLIDLDYSYDTSAFPSWLIYLSLVKMSLNHIGDRRLFKMFKRKDFFLPLLGQRKAYFSNGNLYGKDSSTVKDTSTRKIHVLPIPTSRYGIACWQTVPFIFGWKFHEKLLKSCLEELDAFYYLMHPADLIDTRDLDSEKKIFWERADIPLEKKQDYLEQSIRVILESGREIVTMGELSNKLQAKENVVNTLSK